MEAGSQADRLISQLKAFKQRLLNLDTRNQSLFLRRVVQKRAFDLRARPADERLWKAVIRGTGQALLVPDSDPSPEAEAARQSLKQLQRFSGALYEEKGLQETYLGLCWLEGFLDEHSFVRGPFVLVPCAVDRKREGRGQGFVLSFDEAQAPEVNTALAAAVTKLRTAVPADATEQLQDVFARLRESGAEDGASLFDALCGFVGAIGLPFAPTRFDDALAIAPMKRADVEAVPKGAVRLRSYAVAGVFPQASSALFADFEEMVARAEKGEIDQGIVDNLVDAAADSAEPPAAPVDLDAVKDERINTVLPSDPSQDAVIVRAKEAKCLVVRGPPGTGKSQVIVNLIADALSRGERVLVCCQKRAALDVVHRRLREAGLGDAAFLVHDGERDRPLLYRKMHGIVTSTEPAPGAAADARALSARIDDLVRQLKEVAEPTWTPVHGIRLFHLYARARPGFRATGVVPAGVAALDDAALRDACVRLAEAQPDALRFDREGPLARRRSWADLAPLDRHAMLDALAERIAIDPPPPRPPDDRWVEDARELLPAHLALKDRWYRFALPKWHKAQRFLRRSAAVLGTIPEGAWGPTVERAAAAQAAVRKAARFFEEDAVWEAPGALREQALAHFDAVQEHDRRKAAMPEAEREMLARCLRALPAEAEWADHAAQEATLLWIDEAERRFEALRGDPLARYEKLRAELGAALAEKRAAVAKEVLAATRLRQTTPSFPPGAEVHPNRKAATDWNKLGYELGKKRRIKPLRALMREFPWPLQQVAPCWLASPEVVSEVFPLERDLFDLVVFDEASQLDVERALPVLYRAKRVVVAGDEQQMPPTHWFEASRDEGEEAEEDDFGLDAQRTDSLLVAAKRVYGFDYLGWHYRSRYQELIDWSNHAFYDGALQVAANTERATAHAAIEWVPAGGTWDRQVNPVEVRRCAEIVHEVLRKDREEGRARSIGVITFNAKQMEAVKDEIDRRREADPDFAALWGAATAEDRALDDRPFVKNLENVQGDERDVIVLSVGYGPGADGTFRKQFGVLNREGGENFLNVAVTRARERVLVVCSFEPEQLAVQAATNVGPVRFQQYLLYAKSVSGLRPEETRRVLADLNPEVLAQAAARAKAFESPFEQEVHDALAGRGYQVDTQVGLSGYRIDLAVIDPGKPHRYCLGIECDGAAFHSGKSVRERDIARQAFLEGRGWTIHRVWSRHWWSDREGEVGKLLARLPPVG